MKWYMLNLRVAIDQFINALFNGHCDESISAHAYRMHRDGKPWGALMLVIDTLFFWQDGHCRRSYEAERARTELAPEYRA